MLFRLILLLAAAWVLWRLLRGVRIHVVRGQQPSAPTFEPMARCTRCGVHQPKASLSAAGLCGRCATE